MKIINNLKPTMHEMNEEYIAYCKDVVGLTDSSIKSKRCVLEEFENITGVACLEKLTNKDVERWRSHLIEVQGNVPNTINVKTAHLKAALNWHKHRGVVFKNLEFEDIKKMKNAAPRVRKYYTEAQILRVLRYTQTDQEWLWIKICFDTSMRLNELRNLRVEDFHGSEVQILCKGRKYRHVYISPETRERVEKYIIEHDIRGLMWPDDLPDEDGNERVMDESKIRRRMRRPFKAAGETGFYPHSLRHSAAMDVLFKGGTIRDVQHTLGHSGLQVTEKYIHGMTDIEYKDMWDNRLLQLQRSDSYMVATSTKNL